MPQRGRPFAYAFALMVALSAATPSVMAEETQEFKIRRLPIAEALSAFARQAGISIGRPPLSYRDGKSNRLSGHFSIEEGLQILLKDTDFTFEIASPHVVRIHKKAAKPVRTTEIEDTAEPLIQEILVSSIRRMENIQKLPYGISSIGGTESQDLRLFSTGDTARRIAGMQATNQGLGQNKIIMRGLSDGAFSGRAQSLVSTYFDNTRLTYNAPDPALRLIDIERIEVMRGPQGTLYGSGSLSGLYRVVTNKPALSDVEIAVTASHAFTDGGADSADTTAIFNLPVLEDRLAFRSALYYGKAGGFIDDTRLGLENVNETETYGGRASAMWLLNDRWRLTAGFTFQKHDQKDSNYYNSDLDFGERTNYVQEPRSDKFQQIHATVEGDYDWGDFASSFSWIDRKIGATFDGSLAVPKLVLMDVVASPYSLDRHVDTFSNETHISSKTGRRLEWTVGSFWSERKEHIRSSLLVPGASEVDYLGSTDIVYAERLRSDLREAAFFGELTYYLTEKIAVTGGLRWFDYRERARSDLTDLGIDLVAHTRGEQHSAGLTPKLVLAYHASKDLMFYLQRAEGYRLGGINLAGISLLDEDSTIASLSDYKSDSITNYEAGLKYQSPTGVFTLNASTYAAFWSKLQSQQFSFEGLPDIGNVGDARVFGGELEFRYRPSHRTELQLYVSASDSKLEDAFPRFGASVGTPLPAAPAFTAGASLYQEFDLANDITAALSLDYTYSGSADLLFEHNFSPEMDSYHMENARVAVRRDRWQLTLYASNLLNDRSNVFAFGNPLSLVVIDGEDPDDPNYVWVSTGLHATPLRPRTVGLEIGWRF